MNGDKCQTKYIDGHPCAIHWECDDYTDGTVTSIITGNVVRS